MDLFWAQFSSTDIMSTKMKGLLKGLRYISQIFENEKEQDMEIGYPTDVKHVAHIGWDGPSSAVNDPKSEGGGSTENNASKPDDAHPPRLPDMPRSSRRQSSGGGSAATSEQSDGQKRSRRHQSSSSTSSLPRDGAGKGKPRQLREASPLGSESPSHSASDAPKKNRPKKSKDSSKDGKSEGSSRRARSQASNDPGCDLSAGLEGIAEDGKKCNEV